jgi:hypothetical protein
MSMDRPTYLELVPPAVNPPSLAGGATPLTVCGGVQLAEPTPATDVPAWIATDVALRRLEAALERFKDAERAVNDGMAALAAIRPEDPRRYLAQAWLAPLERASREVEAVLDSMNQVGVV